MVRVDDKECGSDRDAAYTTQCHMCDMRRFQKCCGTGLRQSEDTPVVTSVASAKCSHPTKGHKARLC